MSERPLILAPLVPQVIVRLELDFDPQPDPEALFPDHPGLVLEGHVPGGHVVLERYVDGVLRLNARRVSRWAPESGFRGLVKDLQPQGTSLNAWLLQAFRQDPRLIPEDMRREGHWTYFTGTRFRSSTGICLPAMQWVGGRPDFGCLWGGEESNGRDGVAILEAAA